MARSSEYSYNDQADRGRETNREAEPRVKAKLSQMRDRDYLLMR